MTISGIKVLFFSLVIGLSVFSQNAQGQKNLTYRFQYILIEDGLPQNTINCIEKDQFGFMWFGTSNGICRFDAYSFESFKSEEGYTNSLPDNLISSISAGSNGLVWIGSARGLSYYNHFTDQITQFTDTSFKGDPIRRVSSILAYENTVWVATNENGIYKLTLFENTYSISEHYSIKNRTISNNQVNALYLTNNKILYAATNEGILILDAGTNKFISSPDIMLPNQTFVNNIFEDKQNNMYFSTNSGLFFYSAVNESLSEYTINQKPNSLAHNFVNKVQQDVAGQIWVATLGGLQTFDPLKEQFYSMPEKGPDNFIINNEFINTVYCDSTGNVWIGTEKGGINKFNVYQNPFRFYTNDPNNLNSLNENTVNSVYKEGNKLWIGTAGGGLNLLDLKNQKFVHFINSNYDPASISSNYITCILRGADNNLWVGTWGNGLNAINTNNNKVNIKRVDENASEFQNSPVDIFISSLVNDPRGFLVIGTQGGLSMLEYKTKKFTTLISSENQSPELTEIGCILLDSKGYYWIGTRNGLFHFPQSSIRSTKDDEYIISNLQYYKHNANDSASLPGDYIISFLEDSIGNVWIGTYGNGLAKVNINNNGKLISENFSVNHGLSNNVIYGIEEDNKSNIWLSTDYGLSMLNPTNKSFKNFFMQDGLLNNQFYWTASYKDMNGVIYFGGTEGLNYFNPDELYDYAYSPAPRITKLKIFNKVVKPGEFHHKKLVLNKPVYNSDTILLSYKDNNISFDFSAFDYYLPEKIYYSYMLLGIDKNWVNVPAQRRFANYNNLGGGTYTFLLKASNSDGIWNNEPTKVTIIITPPFWETLFFKIGVILFLLALTGLIIWLQIRRIVAQKKILEDRVKRRTQKIEDQKLILEQQANDLIETNHQLEHRQEQIEQQKEELEAKNDEISKQRDELILLNQKVNEINQLQLKFFTNISHEFKTPLTLIISPLERLINQFKNDKETHHLLHLIHNNAHRLLILIRQLLEIRRTETGNQTLQVELTEPRTFLLDIFNSFEELAEKNNIEYINEITLNKTAWIDKEKLDNVLYNLLSNAFKFTPPGKSIKLSAYNKTKNETDYLCLSVKDTGEGIDPKQFDKLFDRFLQVTESKKHKKAGTGIGLSLVKSLVEIMYGTINVKSALNEGSEFMIEIPVSKKVFAVHEIDTTGQVFESNIKEKVAVLTDQIAEPAEIEYSEQDEDINTILVIEDNKDMRSFICSSLSQYYQVIEAEDGQLGYELAKKKSPSVIISDIMMPGISGLDLCKKIKNNLYTSHIPIILLTARSKTEEQVEGLETGADDYITKPFSIEILIAKIKALIDNRNKLKAKFSKLEDVQPEELKISHLDSKFYERANEIVKKYYTDPAFDVDHFASEMFVSRSQLYSKLKAITNLSANEFINTYRLKKSIELLSSGTMQISEVAYSIGFNDPKYFSRIFKKYYKKSPSDIIRRKGA
ncbi:MAG: response regulator [Bacteroidales bacterium]|nr:response regulator [Bacteroidales bacterium]MBN2818962.1 response regulator [Bacteroidales bacterium]